MTVLLSFVLFLLTITDVKPLIAQDAAQVAPPANPAATISDIVRDPTDVPPPIADRAAIVIHVTLTAEEVIGQLDPSAGTSYRYWTFDGKVPGPMIRVRVTRSRSLFAMMPPVIWSTLSIFMLRSVRVAARRCRRQSQGSRGPLRFKPQRPGCFSIIAGRQ
jgi:hypothetical protein